MRVSLLAFSSLTIVLGACEPERGIRSSRDIESPVDIKCVDQALRQKFSTMERWDYTSDGGIFPKGVNVAQFAYFKWDGGVGWATLHVGSVDGKTRISQEFTGIGFELPQESFPPALKAMADARAVLQNRCALRLYEMKWREIGQNVEALN